MRSKFSLSFSRTSVNGNLIVAGLFLALGTFQREDIVASFEEISLSFSTEEAAKKFVDDVKVPGFGCHNSFQKSVDVIVHPDYAGSQNAARAVYHAINAYKDSLDTINRFDLVFPSEEVMNNLIKNIECYIKAYFGSEALRFE